MDNFYNYNFNIDKKLNQCYNCKIKLDKDCQNIFDSLFFKAKIKCVGCFFKKDIILCKKCFCRECEFVCPRCDIYGIDLITIQKSSK